MSLIARILNAARHLPGALLRVNGHVILHMHSDG